MRFVSLWLPEVSPGDATESSHPYLFVERSRYGSKQVSLDEFANEPCHVTLLDAGFLPGRGRVNFRAALGRFEAAVSVRLVSIAIVLCSHIRSSSSTY